MRTPKPSSDLCWMVGEQWLLLRLWQGSYCPQGIASDLCWMVGEHWLLGHASSDIAGAVSTSHIIRPVSDAYRSGHLRLGGGCL